MQAAAEDKSAPKPYGLITANMAKSTAGIFYADNPDESVKTIDEAIFLIAIDTKGYPADENAAAQDINIRNNHNRDYRKSLQLVVLQNGYSGATCNFFAGVEGVLAARFASWINFICKDNPADRCGKEADPLLKTEFRDNRFRETASGAPEGQSRTIFMRLSPDQDDRCDRQGWNQAIECQSRCVFPRRRAPGLL